MKHHFTINEVVHSFGEPVKPSTFNVVDCTDPYHCFAVMENFPTREEAEAIKRAYEFVLG